MGRGAVGDVHRPFPAAEAQPPGLGGIKHRKDPPAAQVQFQRQRGVQQGGVGDPGFQQAAQQRAGPGLRVRLVQKEDSHPVGVPGGQFRLGGGLRPGEGGVRPVDAGLAEGGGPGQECGQRALGLQPGQGGLGSLIQRTGRGFVAVEPGQAHPGGDPGPGQRAQDRHQRQGHQQFHQCKALAGAGTGLQRRRSPSRASRRGRGPPGGQAGFAPDLIQIIRAPGPHCKQNAKLRPAPGKGGGTAHIFAGGGRQVS